MRLLGAPARVDDGIGVARDDVRHVGEGGVVVVEVVDVVLHEPGVDQSAGAVELLAVVDGEVVGAEVALRRVGTQPEAVVPRAGEQPVLAPQPRHRVAVGGTDEDLALGQVEVGGVRDALARPGAADEHQRVGVHAAGRGVGGGGRAVAVADDSEVRLVARLVGGVEAVDELRERDAARRGVGLGHGVGDVAPRLGDAPRHRLGVEVGGVVADPGDGRDRPLARGVLQEQAVDGLLVEVERLGAVLVDVGAVLHDPGHVDRGVVGGVGVAVGHRRDPVAAERVRLVGHDEGVDVEPGVGRQGRLGEGRLDGLRVLQPPLIAGAQVLARGLEPEEVLDVALDAGAVGLVAVAGRDPVGVADDVGVADQQGVALALREGRPPGVDGVGVGAQPPQLGRQCVGVRPTGVLSRGEALGQLVDGGERADGGVLVGFDPVAPGLQVLLVGLEALPQGHRVGPERLHLVLGGALDAPEEVFAVAVEPLAAVRQRVVLAAALAHPGEELVDGEGTALERGADGFGVTGERGHGVLGGIGGIAGEVCGGTVGAGPLADVADRGRGSTYVGEHGARRLLDLRLRLLRQPGRDGDRGHGPTAETGGVLRSCHIRSCWVSCTLSWSVARKSNMVCASESEWFDARSRRTRTRCSQVVRNASAAGPTRSPSRLGVAWVRFLRGPLRPSAASSHSLRAFARADCHIWMVIARAPPSRPRRRAGPSECAR